MFITSIQRASEVYKFPPNIIPYKPTLVVFKIIYKAGLISGGVGTEGYAGWVYFLNSAIITAGVILLNVPISALLAYSLSKLFTAKWSRVVFLYCIAVMILPGTMQFIPSYMIMKHFPFPTLNIPKIPFTNTPFPHYNFLNTYWAVILPGIYSAFNVLLFKGSFDMIPDELINAARLDGASELSIFSRIVLPISKPIFAVVTYFTFVGTWNNFMWPLIVLKTQGKWPLSLFLYKFQQYLLEWRRYSKASAVREAAKRALEEGLGMNGIMALSIIESIPIIIIFIICREYLMKGIKLRGFK